MAASVVQFQTALMDFGTFCTVLKQVQVKWLISFSVTAEPANFKLVVQVTDAVSSLWEARLSSQDLLAHQTNLGLEQVDWNMYFTLLKSALTEKRVTIRPVGEDLNVDLEYPLAQAKLRGSLKVKKSHSDAREIMSFLMTCIETTLQPHENLKRDRPPSPDLREGQRPVLGIAKPAVKKRKKVKELGAKIA